MHDFCIWPNHHFVYVGLEVVLRTTDSFRRTLGSLHRGCIYNMTRPAVIALCARLELHGQVKPGIETQLLSSVGLFR